MKYSYCIEELMDIYKCLKLKSNWQINVSLEVDRGRLWHRRRLGNEEVLSYM